MNDVILFDGVCNLCNFFVQFVIKRDRRNVFKFASLQSDFGKKILNESGLADANSDSVILYSEGKTYTESKAALKILKKLSGGWKLIYVFIILPKSIRDAVYRFIARNRYKWFGKKDSCMLPTPELKNKFIE